MKRKLQLIFLLMVSSLVFSQGSRDTLQVSKKYKTILIFPENISESIIGNDFGFIADLPKQEGSKFHGRILKLYYDELANENQNYTNHTVITDSGNVYDFILELTDRPKKMTWYITSEMAAHNINGNSTFKKDDSLSKKNSNESVIQKAVSYSEMKIESKSKNSNDIAKATMELYKEDPMEYYRLRSYYMQFDKAKVSRYFSRLDNVFLWLKGVYYNQDELYFQFRIENKEGLDMDINFIKYSLATTYKKSSSNQKLEMEPIFVFKQPKIVAGKSENHFVVVFKKFALDEKKALVIELDEESGNRNLSLEIGHEIINNPIHF